MYTSLAISKEIKTALAYKVPLDHFKRKTASEFENHLRKEYRDDNNTNRFGYDFIASRNFPEQEALKV